MQTRSRRRQSGHRIAVHLVLLALVALLALPMTALGIENPGVVTDQDTGGIQTRFEFTGVTDADSPMTSMTFTFPEGFDLTKVTHRTTALQGLTREPVTAKQVVGDRTVKLVFSPPVKANSSVIFQIYDVLTPVAGGSFNLGVSYQAGGRERSTPPLKFSYVTPSRAEALSRYLEQQPWVSKYNQVKFLNLFMKPQLIVVAIPLLFVGWLASIGLVLLAFPLAITGGLMLAFMKMAKLRIVRWVSGAFVNVIRGTPLFLQIFIAFIGLRIAGLRASDYITAVIVLALNSSAYLAEIFRAGIQSINRGQFEAAASLGMTYPQSMIYVIIPQTVKRVLPTMTSEFILLFKDTSLLMAIGVFELMMYSNTIVARTGNLTPFVVAGVYYLIVTIPLINIVGRLERKLAISEGGQVADPDKKKDKEPGLVDGLTRTTGPEGDGAQAAIDESRKGLRR